MCRILTAGKNVVTSSFVPLIYPWRIVPAFAEQLEAACQQGHGSFYCSGIDPGFSPDTLPIVLSSLSERIESVRAQEIFHYATCDQPQTLFEVMGFGKPHRDHNIDGCVATAMRLVNAIPAVCRAEPGVKSWLDLSTSHLLLDATRCGEVESFVPRMALTEVRDAASTFCGSTGALG